MTTTPPTNTETVGNLEKPWRIQLSSDTDLALPQPLAFILGALEIRVVQRTATLRQVIPNSFETSEVLKPVGLGFDVRTPTGNPQRLQADAVTACNAISQLLAVVHHTAVTRPRFEAMVDLGEGAGPRVLLQCIPSVNVPLSQNPQFDVALMVEFFDHWKAIASPDVQLRVNRALSHLQASYVSEDPVSQFSELWIGMSALNELLKAEFEVEALPVNCSVCKTPTLHCSTCGKQHIQEHRETAVVRGLIRDRLARGNQWKKISKLRQRIAHGGGAMPGQAEALAASIAMREALALAITMVLKLPADRARMLAPERVPLAGDNDLWVVARIETLPVSDLANSETLPEFRDVTGKGGVMLLKGAAPAGRVTVPFAMYGYSGKYTILDFFAQSGSTLLDRIQPAFITGGAPGEGAYH